MIRSKLAELMGKHKLKIQDVNDKTGLDRNTISNLWHDKAKRIDYNTIDKLCELFDCQPGDLIEYIPEKEGEKDEK